MLFGVGGWGASVEWFVLPIKSIRLWEGTGDWSQGVLESANWLSKDLLAL